MRSGVFAFFLILSAFASAQHRCATKAPIDGAFETWMEKAMEVRSLRMRARTTNNSVVQIPVVVHVFHKGEPVGSGANLSDERIMGQIDSLTADFRRLNEDRMNTPAVFQPIAADIQIEFVLAKLDPTGNPTNGIVRLKGSRDRYRANSHLALLRSESSWPAQHYLNIYVVDLQSFIGFASFPVISLDGIDNNVDDFIFDGVLVDFEYFGVNPTTPTFESFGRTLTHEVGHYFGLRHIWGDGGCDIDDFVADTPPADIDNGDYSSPCTFPNPNDREVCVPTEPEMFQNYMDYTDDICMNLFTEGQKNRMRTVLDNALNRHSLTTSPGLIEPTRFANDLSVVKINAPSFVSCESTIVLELIVQNQGTDLISTYDVQLLIDNFPQGSPISVTEALNPFQQDTITFNALSVRGLPTEIGFDLINVNGDTDDDVTNNSIGIILREVSSQDLPFFEDFEGAQNLLGSFGNDRPWEVLSAPSEIPENQALGFKAFNNTEWFSEDRIFETPVFDLTGLPSGEIQFSYAHASRTLSQYDGLMIKASLDCGETYPDIIFSSFGSNLATVESTDDYFTPANQLDWADTIVSITEYRDIDGVQFAFVGINGSGNNIYLDDIRILETNLFDNDIRPTNLVAPLITCSPSSNVRLRIRNVGALKVNAFTVEYIVNGDVQVASFENLSIESKGYANFNLTADNLVEGTNTFSAEIVSVNGVPDESMNENTIETELFRDDLTDEYPLIVDFESSDSWSIATSGRDQLFERNTLTGNSVLRANGFGVTDLGTDNWFISPRLSNVNLDSVGLYFRASYASNPGFEDRLEVRLSTDCGETYSTKLVDLSSDSLAVTSSNTEWIPQSPSDWKEYRIGLSETVLLSDVIRIAFVFVPGGGNDLYIDDISIRGNEPPSYDDVVRVFPNPAIDQFNVGLNLPIKEPVLLRVLDISGKVIYEERVSNALNQVLEYRAPSQGGLYFLTLQGKTFKATQKLFISR